MLGHARLHRHPVDFLGAGEQAAAELGVAPGEHGADGVVRQETATVLLAALRQARDVQDGQDDHVERRRKPVDRLAVQLVDEIADAETKTFLATMETAETTRKLPARLSRLPGVPGE